MTRDHSKRRGVNELESAAKLVATALRKRQMLFLGGALHADHKLADVLRDFATQDGNMADLLDLALDGCEEDA
jgi:hypothetical protein